METKKVYAVTLNWNRCQDTLNCIGSLVSQTQPGLQIMVVDNASQDGSPEEISKHYPFVEQIINEENLGFGRGFNTGIRAALARGADFVFIINNDAWIAPDGIEKLVNKAGKDTGMLAPVIFYADQPGLIWSAGGKFDPLTLEVRHFLKNQPEPANWPEEVEQDFVTGCALLLPKETCESIGLFDEGFHAYYEDIDYAYRVRHAGLKNVLVPGARAWHKVSMSSGGSDTPNERYWMARSSIRYFAKHARAWQVPVIFLYRFGSAIKMTLKLFNNKRIDSLRAYWRGLRDGLRESMHLSSG